jgi:hypothetical protein
MFRVVAGSACFTMGWSSHFRTQNYWFDINWSLPISLAATWAWLAVFLAALWRTGLGGLWLLPLVPIAANYQLLAAMLAFACSQGDCL